jgi:hypothetical protein
MRDELCQSFALLPGGSVPRIWVAKPRESGIEKLIGRGRRLPARAVSVERPAKHQLRGTITLGRHAPEPMVDER